MPTGYPKNPAATLAKRQASNAKALRIDEERVANGGPLVVKRVYKKQTSPRKNSVAQLTADLTKRTETIKNLENLLKVAQERIEILETQKKGMPGEGLTIVKVSKDLAESVRTVKELNGKVETLEEKLEESYANNKDLFDQLSNMRMYLFAVLDLVAHQQ